MSINIEEAVRYLQVGVDALRWEDYNLHIVPTDTGFEVWGDNTSIWFVVYELVSGAYPEYSTYVLEYLSGDMKDLKSYRKSCVGRFKSIDRVMSYTLTQIMKLMIDSAFESLTYDLMEEKEEAVISVDTPQ